MVFLARILVAALLLVLPVAAATNSVTLTELTGSAQTSRPFSISRVFAQGEIAAYAQPSVSGTPLSTWQCDKLSSWPDGSLKHAIISFKYSLTASGAVTVSFVNNTNPSSAGNLAATQAAALTQAQMLAFDPGTGASTWGAEIDALQGTTQTANARTMLTAGSWRYWLRGPVVTQVIVEDRTSTRAYDFGWQCASNCTATDYTTVTWSTAPSATYKSLHPIFVETFYPGWSGVQTDYILEDPWTDRLQDQYYSLTLKAHSDQSITQFTRTNLWHNAATRWRERYWEGTTPARVKTDLNFPYLVQSHAVLNWDQTKVVGAGAISQEKTSFQSFMASSSTFLTSLPENLLDIRSNGEYIWDTGSSGGRGEIGPLPRWDVRWLYTQDEGLYRVMLGNAATLAQMPYHVREARTDNYFLSSALEPTPTTKAFGYFLSNDARPSGNFYNIYGGSGSDPISPVGTNRDAPGAGGDPFGTLLLSGRDNSTTMWAIDMGHIVPTAYSAYLATGDWFWLEEVYASAHWSTYYQSNDGGLALLDEYNFNGRGLAWPLRNLAFGAFLAPDGDKEGLYLNEKTANNIAVNEGKFNLTTGTYYNNAAWQYGKNSNLYYNRNKNCDGCSSSASASDPLYYPYFQTNTNIAGTTGLFCEFSSSTVGREHSPWQVGYIITAFGWMQRLGFTDADLVLGAHSKYIVDLVQAPGTSGYSYNPYLIAFDSAPGLDVNSNWFQTGSSLLTAWTTATSGPSCSTGQNDGITVGTNLQTLNSWYTDSTITQSVGGQDIESGFVWEMYGPTALAAPYSDSATGLTGSGSWNWYTSAASSQVSHLGSNQATCSDVSNCDNPKWALAPLALTCSISPTSLPNGTVGSAYSQALTASNCNTSTFTLASGSLPTGMSLSTSGTISGTPSAAGTFSFSVAYDTASQPESIAVSSAGATGAPATVNGGFHLGGSAVIK